MPESLGNVIQDTYDFEAWLAKQLPIVRQDIHTKHASMSQAAFPFFRATFYRWVRLWPSVCEDLAKAPHLLAVGDLHIENFGTWRDQEGRLIWGVNDLDEAWPAPYTIDLVRLAASVYIAVKEDHLCIPRREAAEAIEEGYRDGVAKGGQPFVLAEEHQWLRLLALGKLRDPVRFWSKMVRLPGYSGEAPQEVRKLIELELPSGTGDYQLKRRTAGLGSLGHPRILALASAQGAWIAREAKAIRPSAWAWVKKSKSRDVHCGQLARIAVRVPDPFLKFHGQWVVRRLAPDCSRIELASLPQARQEAKLLYSMGRETANIHWGSATSMAEVKRDLAHRKGRWLHRAAKAMYKATREDWEEWRRGAKKFHKKSSQPT
ncbi:MAG: hypothetical protein NVS9B4_25110 [Candidatus Acidiferrum sp.]